MKKSLAIILALGLALTSCSSQEAPKEKRIEDPEVLEKIWEEYIDDMPFTVSSSLLSWEDPKEIEPLALCNYLFLKMQRRSDVEDTNFDDIINEKSASLSVKADKFISYHNEYFTKPFDYRSINSIGCYYDEKTDSVILETPYLIAQLPDVKYNEFSEFPNFSLDEVTFYPAEKKLEAKIGINDYRIPTLDENNKIYNYTTFSVEENKKLKLISSDVEVLPLKGSYIKGEMKKLPAVKSLDKFTTTGPLKTTLPLFSYNSEGLKVSSFDMETGSLNEGYIIPLKEHHAESNVLLRDGHLLLIETIYKLLPDGNIDSRNNEIHLSEIYLDSKDQREIEIPEECIYISDVSSDLSKMLYKESMDGDFIIYDFIDKKKTIVPDTAPEIPQTQDPQELMGIEAFGHGRFSKDGTMLVLFKFGYEWGAGYAVYDILTGATIQYPVVTSWGGYPIMTPSGLYIGGISDEGNSSYSHGFLKFHEGEIRKLPATPFPENFRYPYVPSGENRFIAMLMPVNEEDYYNVSNTGLSQMAVTVFDSESLTIKDTGARLNRPPYTNCLIFVLDDGNIFIYDSGISLENSYIIKNPFLD